MTSAIGMAKGMNDVQRFDVKSPFDRNLLAEFPKMVPDQDGQFVRYTDYAALQEERDELSSNLGISMQAVKNLEQQLAAAREELQAEEAELARVRLQLHEAQNECDNLTSISARNERDAGRYRWLREHGNEFYNAVHYRGVGITVDADIDATLQRDRQP